MTDLLLALGSFSLFLVTVSAAVGSVGYWILAPMHRATHMQNHHHVTLFQLYLTWLPVTPTQPYQMNTNHRIV